MDDLTDKINSLLSSPDSMQKIQSLMAALGGDAPQGAPPPVQSSASQKPTAGGADLAGLLSALTGAATANTASVQGGDGPDLGVLMKLAPVLSGMTKEDENTSLLKALRPYLHGDREKRLDDAIQILKLLRVLPLLDISGLVKGKDEPN